MSKKHFIELADCLIQLRKMNLRCHQTEAVDFQDLVQTLAEFCKSQNPQFKRQLWLDYINGKCGPNGGTVKP